VATPYRHEIVTIGVELSCVILWIQLINAVAWVSYVCLCLCVRVFVCVCVCVFARARALFSEQY